MPFDVNPEFFLKQHGRDQKCTQKLTAFFNINGYFVSIHTTVSDRKWEMY